MPSAGATRPQGRSPGNIGGGVRVATGVTSGPNPWRAAWSLLRAYRTRRPAPRGTGGVEHDGLQPVLDAVAEGGVAALEGVASALDAYRAALHDVEPDRLTHSHALAYWINLYNAEALDAARAAFGRGEVSVLGIPGVFDRPRVAVAGEQLSLDAIEHGKVRRFRDPRIHGGLVCGSLSCPTLRAEPFDGEAVDLQLDDQMRSFLSGGGAVVDRDAGTLSLSRVLRWFGSDFVSPHRMPAILPARAGDVGAALTAWMGPDDAEWVDRARPAVTFQRYDWGRGCAVR